MTRTTSETRRAISRGVAMFLGGFTLLNILGEIVSRHFDGNYWWIDLRPLPVGLAGPMLGTSAVLLLAYAVRPAAPSWRRLATAGAAGLLAAFAAFNSIEFFALLARGRIHSRFPVPLSLFVLAALLVILLDVTPRDQTSARRGKASRWGDLDGAESATPRRPGFWTRGRGLGRRGRASPEDSNFPTRASSRRGKAAPVDLDGAESATPRRPGFWTRRGDPGRRGGTSSDDSAFRRRFAPA